MARPNGLRPNCEAHRGQVRRCWPFRADLAGLIVSSAHELGGIARRPGIRPKAPPMVIVPGVGSLNLRTGTTDVTTSPPQSTESTSAFADPLAFPEESRDTG